METFQGLTFFGIPITDGAWYIVLALLLIDLIIRIAMLTYIPKGRKPTAAMAWLLFIALIPFAGFIAFLIFGNTKLSKIRRKQQAHINAIIKNYTAELRKDGHIIEVPAPYHNQAALAENLTGFPVTADNTVALITHYDEIIDQIVKAVDKATSHAYVEFYILALDDTTEPFFQALERATQRGVAVHVLFDAWGSRKYPRYKEMQARLTRASIPWHKILPVTLVPGKYNRFDLRNHRKIVVVDNEVAFIGSFNMIDKRYHRKDDISYIELAAKLRGSSVSEAATVFVSDWYFETNETLEHISPLLAPEHKDGSLVQLIPSGSNYHYANNLLFFTSMVASAQKYIYITNPYLVPDESLFNALISAAQRGVKVSILNSEAMDQWMVGHAQRSYYEELLSAGVSIYLYKKPQLVHEKFISVDDIKAVIGSSNMDIRSFELNLECTVAVYDPKIAKELSSHHKKLRHHAHRITLEEWKKRRGWQSFLDSIARLTSALQ